MPCQLYLASDRQPVDLQWYELCAFAKLQQLVDVQVDRLPVIR